MKTGNYYKIEETVVAYGETLHFSPINAYCVDCAPEGAKLYGAIQCTHTVCETCGALLAVNYVKPVDEGEFDFLTAPIKKVS